MKLLMTMLVAACLPLESICTSTELDPSISLFLQASCLHCHDSSTETQLNLESLSRNLSDPDTRRAWVDIFDRIRNGTMPPEPEPCPDPAAAKLATDALQNLLTEITRTQQHRIGRVPARRLTKREYQFTIQDLLGIERDVARHLPDEAESIGFDTVAHSQRLSAIHMEGFLRAADEALHEALTLGVNPFREISLNFSNNGNFDYFENKSLHEGGNTMRRLDKGVAIFLDNDYLIHSYRAMGLNVESAGTYRIMASLHAFQASQEVTYKIIAKRPNGDARLVSLGDLQPGVEELVETDVFLDRGDSFYVTLQNAAPAATYMKLMFMDAGSYAGPGLAVRALSVAGPIHDEWPPERTRKLLHGVEFVTDSATGLTNLKVVKQPMEHVREIVEAFAERAFGRPTTQAEVASFVELARPAVTAGRPLEEVIRVPLRAILCSPQFLLPTCKPGKLDAFSLARRLSSFLWKSVPDAELLDAARAGALTTDEELERQTDRMLDDRRSQRFVNDFVGQWLLLDEVNATSPDARLYPEYDELLGDAIPRETQLFFAELIRENAPLTDLIDSDYAFVNRRLADHYGIPGIKGQHFRKIQLPEGSPRGGVLTQAAILKTTANGTVTSPVTRGSFVLTQLLGTPPSPPPPGVGSIEPDTRGTTTIREKLAAHRDDHSCNACHRLIDPPGFALESFDPIGAMRSRYRASGPGEGLLAMFSPATYHDGPRVDPSGETADGRQFSGIVEFKRLLMEHREQVARNFVSQLIVYSTGGDLEFADREVVEAILRKTEKHSYPVRDLIHAVLQSHLFRCT